MLKAKSIQSICASCRLNIAITRARNARLPQSASHLRLAQTSIFTQQRALSTTLLRRQQAPDHANTSEEVSIDPAAHRLNVEVNVRRARQQFRDALPRDHLTAEEYALYERLYGPPILVDTAEELLAPEKEPEEIITEEQPDGSTVLLRRGEDGELEEIDLYEEDDAVDELEDEDEKSKTPEEWEEYREQKAATFHENVYEQSRMYHEEAEAWEDEEEVEEKTFMRAHPLTIAGRFKPSPSTVFLPKETLVDPTAQLLTRANHKHLTESANRIFGGRGLPHSASTPPARLGKEQKPITLDPSQAEMGNIEADAYMAAVQPGTYASVMSTLVEVRRRLGTSWMDHMLAKKGGNILDAGSGGVGVLAWHEILRAEHERKQEDAAEEPEQTNTSEGNPEDPPSPKTATPEPAPLGKATVLTSSDTLRHRASRLLENTTFIPRLPEHVPPSSEANQAQPRKVYDIIIAPHTLWPLKQEYLRKDQVAKYWSLLNPKGGVLVLIEKGLPRGFEVIAAARQQLLSRYISSPNSTTLETPLDEQLRNPDEDTRFTTKETGMIIAPCTNHQPCPMYTTPGKSAGRKDFCFFTQRYIRPPYLQRILNAKDKNHEDIQFSYLAVQRGRDQRLPEHDPLGLGITQDASTTDAAFKGHEWSPLSPDPLNPLPTTPAQINPLTLPRLILPALKRRGHIILDLCTPSGTLERWTVPRSFSKQAFRDAKKSRWGDLWALGAKTRIPKNVRLGRPGDEFDRKGRLVRKVKKVVVEIGVGERDGKAVDVGEDRVTMGGKRFGDRDGRYSMDRKIRGSGGRKGRKKNVNFFDE